MHSETINSEEFFLFSLFHSLRFHFMYIFTVSFLFSTVFLIFIFLCIQYWIFVVSLVFKWIEFSRVSLTFHILAYFQNITWQKSQKKSEWNRMISRTLWGFELFRFYGACFWIIFYARKKETFFPSSCNVTGMTTKTNSEKKKNKREEKLYRREFSVSWEISHNKNRLKTFSTGFDS